jgi:hypothetical protein
MGTATAAGILMRQTGGALGVAAFGALFASGLSASLGADGAALLGELGPQTLATLSPQVQAQAAQAVIAAVHPIYWISATMAAIGLLFSFLLRDIPLASRRPAHANE